MHGNLDQGQNPEDPAAWQALQDWLSRDEDGQVILAHLQADPAGGIETLRQWFQVNQGKTPPQLATYVSGGDVGKLINIAQAGVVLIQQDLQPIPPSDLYQLPGDIADFSGREREMADLTAILEQAVEGGATAVGIAAVSEMAGVGKSALAIHAAHSLKNRFPYQLYVDLRGGAGSEPVDPSDALKDLLQALDVREQFMPGDLGGRARLYRSLLVSKHALILLDNARDEAQVRPLLPGMPTCAVLVTSRRRLSALEGATIFELDILTEEEALSLMERLATAERIKETEESAKQIVQLCGYLPLAVRIAASKLKDKPHWTLQDYAMRLANERSRLERLKLSDLDVRSTFAFSYGDMSDDDARLFRLLGVLDNSKFLLADVAAIWQKPLEIAWDILERQADVQLVEPEVADGKNWDGDRAYRIHDLIRLFATEELEKEAPSRLRQDARRRAEEGRSLSGLRTFAYIKSIEASEGSWKEAIRSYEKMIKEQRKLRISDSRSEGSLLKDISVLYAQLGSSYGKKGAWRKAIRNIEKSVKTFRGSPLGESPALTLMEQGILCARRGEAEKALQHWYDALSELDPDYVETSQGLAQAARFLKEFEETKTVWLRPGQQALDLINRARLDEAMELLEERERVIKEQKAIAERVGIISLGGFPLGGDDKDYQLQVNYVLQARILCAQERFQEAINYIGEVQARIGEIQAVAAQLGDEGARGIEGLAKEQLADCYVKWGAFAFEQDELYDAKEKLSAALELYRELDNTEKINLLQDVLEEIGE